MNTLTFDVNNRLQLVFSQEKPDDAVLVETVSPDGKRERRSIIQAGGMVMLHNLYRYVMDNDIRNEFLNPLGKNEDESALTRAAGTPEKYAEAYRAKLAEGESLQALNAANHLALETKAITQAHFFAAARVLQEEILKP